MTQQADLYRLAFISKTSLKTQHFDISLGIVGFDFYTSCSFNCSVLSVFRLQSMNHFILEEISHNELPFLKVPNNLIHACPCCTLALYCQRSEYKQWVSLTAYSICVSVIACTPIVRQIIIYLYFSSVHITITSLEYQPSDITLITIVDWTSVCLFQVTRNKHQRWTPSCVSVCWPS